jgi:hypothetical protein
MVDITMQDARCKTKQDPRSEIRDTRERERERRGADGGAAGARYG